MYYVCTTSACFQGQIFNLGQENPQNDFSLMRKIEQFNSQWLIIADFLYCALFV